MATKKDTTQDIAVTPGFTDTVINTKTDDRRRSDSTERAHVTVIPKGDESVESLLRRFKREVMRAGLMKRMKELEFYEKPSLRKKREREERRRAKKEGFEFEEFEWVEE